MKSHTDGFAVFIHVSCGLPQRQHKDLPSPLLLQSPDHIVTAQSEISHCSYPVLCVFGV